MSQVKKWGRVFFLKMLRDFLFFFLVLFTAGMARGMFVVTISILVSFP